MKWKQIPSAPEYWVSRFGEVYSTHVGRTLKPGLGKRGYYIVSIGGRSRYVHRLVLEAWVDPSKQQGRHLDGNKSNNSIDNLAYGSQSQNEADKVLHNKSNDGERNGRSVLTVDQVLQIARSTKQGSVLAKEYGVSPSTISRIKNKTHWRKVLNV